MKVLFFRLCRKFNLKASVTYFQICVCVKYVRKIMACAVKRLGGLSYLWPNALHNKGLFNDLVTSLGLFICVSKWPFEPKILARNLGTFFVPKFDVKMFQAKISCQKFWHRAKILAQNFGMEYWHEILHQNFWHIFSLPKF